MTKFVKKQIKTKKKEVKDSVTHDEEDSLASQTSIAKRMAQSTKKKLGSVMKRVKKKGKGSSATPEKKPPTHIETDMTLDTTPVSPISSIGEEEKHTAEVVEIPKVVEEDAKPEPRDLSVVYEDDNDGSKEGQLCGDFCACAIL